MKLPVVFTPEAQNDFDRAAEWYEHKTGLGAGFTIEVPRALARIAQMPKMECLMKAWTFGP